MWEVNAVEGFVVIIFIILTIIVVLILIIIIIIIILTPIFTLMQGKFCRKFCGGCEDAYRHSTVIPTKKNGSFRGIHRPSSRPTATTHP
jgi:uncharacterized BrkB/YihY/UPF0761 family membrane protein